MSRPAQSARTALTIASLLAVAGAAHAQSFNVEVFNVVGSPSAPASSYGAASGQTGTWNTIRAGSIGTPATITGLGLNGVATGVSIGLGSNNGSGSGSFGSGDYAGLMGDYADGNGNASQVFMTFSGLTPGFYRAWVYAALPPSQASYIDTFGTTVYHPHFVSSMIGAVTQDTGNTSGPSTANVFTNGRTHTVVDFKVTSAGQVAKVQIFGDSSYFAARIALNGVQLVQYPSSRLYVDHDAVGTGTGQSWTNAMTTLNEALAVAKTSAGSITEIWVAEGVYKPTTTSNRSISFDVPSGVKIYGGFAGTESALSQRDWEANVTTLSGDIGEPRDSVDNSYNILVMNNCNFNTLLDGFRVVSGRAYNNGIGNPEGSGGGITMLDASPVIRNCAFTDNSGLDGGAIKATGSSSPTITNCQFLRNWGGGGGGGIDLDTDKGPAAQFSDITNCFFADNSTNNGGGGILLEGKAYIANCVFTGNTTILSGAGVRVQNATADLATTTIYNCTFAGNSTTNPGAAVGGDGNAVTIGIYNSIIWGNDSILGSGSQDAYDSDNGADFSVDRTIIQGAIVLPGFTNYNFDPLFVDADGADNFVGTADDNLRLQPTSAAIDRGQNNYLPSDGIDLDQDNNAIEQLPVDLDFNPRRFDVSTVGNTGVGTAPFVDLGAYESQYTPPCPLDYNEDSIRNLDDLSDFITDYYTVPTIPGGLQPLAPTLFDVNVGYGVPCPAAPDADAPYAADALRVNGYRVGFSADGSNNCPASPEQNFPSLDNLSEFITAFYASPC
jgi:hypothetical protein